jgi:hypothetical protein
MGLLWRVNRIAEEVTGDRLLVTGGRGGTRNAEKLFGPGLLRIVYRESKVERGTSNRRPTAVFCERVQER